MESWVIWLVVYSTTTVVLLLCTGLFLFVRNRKFKSLSYQENTLQPAVTPAVWKAAPPVSRFSKAGSGIPFPDELDEEAERARLDFITPDKQEGDDEKIYSQTGMSKSYFGGFLKWSWIFMVFFSKLSILFLGLDSYGVLPMNWQSMTKDASTGVVAPSNGHFIWTNISIPVLVIFIVLHSIMITMALFNINVTFMMPAPLATCTHVENKSNSIKPHI